MNKLLKPVELKLKRCEEQLLNLTKVISEWGSNNPIKANIVLLDDRLGYKLVVEQTPELDELNKFGILVGEFVHNARSSLDNLAYSLARLYSDPPNNVWELYFPIFINETDFKDRWKSKNENKFSTAVFDLLQKIQPYNRNQAGVEGTPEQDPLVILNKLSNEDKHRIPKVTLFQPKDIKFSKTLQFYNDEDASSNVPSIVPPTIYIKETINSGDVVLEHKLTRPIKNVTGAIEYSGRVVLKVGDFHEDVGVYLNYLLNYVKLVKNQFTSFFPLD